MSRQQIYTPKSKNRTSLVFSVVKGRVVVISAFNFECAKTDEYGEVISRAERAILHKVTLGGGSLPHSDSACGCCVIPAEVARIESSEPLVSCGCTWDIHAGNNLSVLSVPGYYVFELCDESSEGKVTIEVEELTIKEASLLPENLFLGA